MVDNKNDYTAFANSMVDKALKASFGEVGSDLTVSFKKTVLIREYETEVIEASSTVKLDKPITGAERIFITALVRIQLEYEAYCNLLMKGLITKSKFDDRKLSLANEMNAIKTKAEELTGQSMDKYLDMHI